MSNPRRPSPKWMVGITTVPQRHNDLLVQTVHSLCDAGFDQPRLFVDGCDNPQDYSKFKLPVTHRPSPPLKIVGNWMLGMWELYIREPHADRYAMFQDDILCVGNLRAYLDKCTYPINGYWNLYTHTENLQHTKGKPGWCESNQAGLGALGVVFDRDMLQKVLTDGHMVRKPASAKRTRAWKALDGGVVQVFRNMGGKEYVHNPSLLQHAGTESTLGNKHYPPIESFPGTNFDALTLVQA